MKMGMRKQEVDDDSETDSDSDKQQMKGREGDEQRWKKEQVQTGQERKRKRRKTREEGGGKVSATNTTALVASSPCRAGAGKTTHDCRSNPSSGPNWSSAVAMVTVPIMPLSCGLSPSS